MRAIWGRWLSVIILAGLSAAPAWGGTCTAEFDSTFALLRSIFDRHGCASAYCHDASASGGLDLSAGDVYDHLVDAPVQTVAEPPRPPPHRPAEEGEQPPVAERRRGDVTRPVVGTAAADAAGRAPPLSLAELQVLQLWIEDGAPRTGVVPGTGELVDACLPPPEPLETKPLDPPPPGVGVQLRPPTQMLPAHSEREVCFVTYYDLTDQVPPQFRGPSGTTFRYKHIDARQDPLSHHAVVIPYLGPAAIDSPIWGPFTCNGASGGAACDPTATAACGADAVCASPPTPSVRASATGRATPASASATTASSTPWPPAWVRHRASTPRRRCAARWCGTRTHTT